MSNQEKQNPPGWPFKVLSAFSEWPLHGLVLAAAAEVLTAPPPHRKEMSLKMAERFFRCGARLATEFGLEPVALLALAEKQIVRELGEKAATTLDLHREMEREKVLSAAASAELSAEIRAAMIAAAKGGN